MNNSLYQLEQNIINQIHENPQYTSKTRGELINELDKVRQIQSEEYNKLYNSREATQSVYNSNLQSLKEQTDALKVVDNEMKHAENKWNDLDEELVTKQRLAEFNASYADRYYAQTQILIAIVVSLIVLFILMKIRGIIPETIFKFLLILCGSLSTIYILSHIVDIYYRSDMDFSKYDYSKEDGTGNYNSKNTLNMSFKDLWKLPSVSCIGQECCETGYTHVDATNKCTPNNDLPTGVKPYVPPKKSKSNMVSNNYMMLV